jgi:hypothetical protein
MQCQQASQVDVGFIQHRLQIRVLPGTASEYHLVVAAVDERRSGELRKPTIYHCTSIKFEQRIAVGCAVCTHYLEHIRTLSSSTP